MEMFGAGSNLKDKSDEEIFYQDFKRFTAGKVMIGVGQITSLNGGELEGLKHRMPEFMEKAREGSGLDMVFFMLTNIIEESTELLYYGSGAKEVIDRVHGSDLPGPGCRTACGQGISSGFGGGNTKGGTHP